MPDGVPVEMTSPGSSVITNVMNSTRCSMPKDQLRGRRRLTQLAVHPRFDCRAAPPSSADRDARPDRREGVEALAARVLRFLVLQIARRHVVQAGEPEDVVPGACAAAPDARGGRSRRPARLRSRRGRRPAEPIGAPGSITAVDGLMNSSGSAGSGLFDFRRVILVVQPDADDLRRPHRREESSPRRDRRAPVAASVAAEDVAAASDARRSSPSRSTATKRSPSCMTR